jgi:osmotically-inducible protein OsmY
MLNVSEQIKQNVVNHLCWDSRVDASEIKVEVSRDKVTLSGTVPTYDARKFALEDTLFVDGVNSVENNIIVRYPHRMQVPSDAEMKINIENTLRWNPTLDSSDIKVAVNHGAVTIEGSVDSFWKKMKAEELVSEMKGVISVVNMLAVVPLKQALDEEIADDIIAALNRMSHVKADWINVKVEDGRVTLSGRVPDWSGYYAAFDAARYTSDVVDVVNNIKVLNIRQAHAEL